MTTPTAKTLIEVRGLSVRFSAGKRKWLTNRTRELTAVDDVSLDIRTGETIGLVGESGSGKTTLGRSILGITKIARGSVIYHLDHTDIDRLAPSIPTLNAKPEEGVRLSDLSAKDLRMFRSRMSLVFQDPYSSLNPRMTIHDVIAEPLVTGKPRPDRNHINHRVREIAALCKIDLDHLRRFPHAFSGGQRQRICIARALVNRPNFVVCDESVSALDVSIQAEILNLLKDLQEKTGVAFLFITHDLSTVVQISHRVAVMYVGKIMELASTQDLFKKPRHPYTHALLSAIPRTDSHVPFTPLTLQGEAPNPMESTQGCRFHTRCPFARDRCAQEEPSWRRVAPNHHVSCHFSEEFDFSRPIHPASPPTASSTES